MRPSWLPADQYPFTSRWIEVGGKSVHFIDEGTGPVLLFVHAGPVWSFVFRGLIETLREDGFRCVALDFPGSGLSPAVSDPPGLQSASELLTEFAAELGLERYTLVVNDLGGPVAFGGIAAAHPERVQGIVVAEAFGWSLADENPKVARMLRIVGSAPVGAINSVTNFLALGTSSKFGVGRHLGRRGRVAFRGPYRDRQVRRNALLMLGDAARAGDFMQKVDEAVRKELAGTPLLLVFGQKSPVVKEGFPGLWKQRFPDARVLVVEGGHHFPQMDDPLGVAETIRAWWHEEVASNRAVQSG